MLSLPYPGLNGLKTKELIFSLGQVLASEISLQTLKVLGDAFGGSCSQAVMGGLVCSPQEVWSQARRKMSRGDTALLLPRGGDVAASRQPKPGPGSGSRFLGSWAYGAKRQKPHLVPSGNWTGEKDLCARGSASDARLRWRP